MAGSITSPTHGAAFNAVAGAYERHRPSYPEKLIDRACELAGLTPGDRVLEIGCGTGQLTQSLLARGLQVTALEPGEELLNRARDRLAGGPGLELIDASLEEATLPAKHFRAVFSASAIHWVDPDIGWRRIAATLADDGSLALLSYFGLDDPHSRGDQESLRAGLAAVAPREARQWPIYRELSSLLDGAEQRRHNISEMWAWLGTYEVARGFVTDLFEDAQLAAVPVAVEHTAEELGALLGTMSFWTRLSAAQRDALMAENQALYRRLSRPIRSSTVACLALARRQAAEPS